MIGLQNVTIGMANQNSDNIGVNKASDFHLPFLEIAIGDLQPRVHLVERSDQIVKLIRRHEADAARAEAVPANREDRIP